MEDEDGTEGLKTPPLLQARAFSATGGGNASLWYPYLVPPGRYDLIVHVTGMDEPLPVAEGIGTDSRTTTGNSTPGCSRAKPTLDFDCPRVLPWATQTRLR